MLKADLHIHSQYSFDCRNSLDGIIDRCLAVGINCIAVADHGTVEGALKLREMAPFKVIVAEEVLTPAGEIMGMFLSETVPSHITVAEAISRIKAQGGLVCIPHPFDYMRGINQRMQPLDELAGSIDVVEVFNARALPLPWNDRKARKFAARHGLPRSAGSDAHTLGEIGPTYVEMEDFEDKEGFLHSLGNARYHVRRSCPTVHMFSAWNSMTGHFRKPGGH